MPRRPRKPALPSSAELRNLLDAHCPATVLAMLPADVPPALGVYRAEALLDLDCTDAAREYLDPLVSQLTGDAFAAAERLWAQILLRSGWIDPAILSAQNAVEAAEQDDTRAQALAWAALGYAQKGCWRLADQSLGRALELAPDQPRVLAVQARMRLEADQRIEARRLYERMMRHTSLWAQAYGGWGLSHVAYLLGELKQAKKFAKEAIEYSSEFLGPLFVLGQVAMAQDDLPGLQRAIKELRQRSPQSEALASFIQELERLKARLKSANAPGRRRLAAFPTLVQRRDYCGPSTIELVLRYWKGGLDLTNDQIAEQVKLPQSGTPIYRMREFFHLVGFDTLRSAVPVERLKSLIDAGYPTIIQEEYSNSSHVVVAIGYDESTGTIEVQDPMTHVVSSTPLEDLNRRRRTFLDSAVVAFPRGQGHDSALARMNVFDSPALVWVDQAVLELDEGRPQAAVELVERATRRQPALALAWMVRLNAGIDLWRAGLSSQQPEAAAQARQRFYEALARARTTHPQAEFTHVFEGNAALLDGDWERAMQAFQQAIEADPGDARNYAYLAECLFGLRRPDEAIDAARNALARDPSQVTANVWMARALTASGRGTAGHYARAALELAPNWWLAHLALAEVFLDDDEYWEARKAAEQALSLAPGEAEAGMVRGLIHAWSGEADAAEGRLLASLQAAPPLSPHSLYHAQKTLCRLAFGRQRFDQALERVAQLQQSFPNDPWALQFAAASYCETLLQDPAPADSSDGQQQPETEEEEGPPTAATLDEVQRQYDQALTASAGSVYIARDYLAYILRLSGMELALQVIERLRQQYQDVDGLLHLHAQYLDRAGQSEAAARWMVEALGRPDGLQDNEELHQAVVIILHGLGAEAAEQAIMSAPEVEGAPPLVARRRSLGMALSVLPEQVERARAHLQAALDDDPEDAAVVLHLGDVAANPEQREAYYRRTLMLAPRWPHARSTLADFLINAGRAAEALEFTAGHESESLGVLASHADALLALGRYEEAAEAFAQTVEQAQEADNWVYVQLWRAQIEAGWYADALQTASDGLRLFPDDVRWHVRLAASLRLLDRHVEARAALEQGQAAGLSQPDALRELFHQAYAVQDLTTARQWLEQLAGLEGEAAQSDRLSWAENNMLHLLLEEGAVEQARQMLTTHSLSADGWANAAWTAMLSRHYAFTLEVAEQTLRQAPEHFGGLVARAEALGELDREDEAIEALNRLRQLHPQQHNAYEKLALRLAVAGQLEQALELADLAIDLGAYCPFAWAVRGFVHLAYGMRDDARSDLLAAWNRADIQRRRQSAVYWWMLAALQDAAEPAAAYRRQAEAEAHTRLDRAMLEQIAALLQPG